MNGSCFFCWQSSLDSQVNLLLLPYYNHTERLVLKMNCPTGVLSKQIDAMCRNACKQVGILYRQFYGHSSPDCLRQLYISLVRSKLEYAAPVWDPHQQTSIHKLEKVQKFALRVCTKLWTRDYDSLLDTMDLPSLSIRRLYLKLSYLYQVINGHFKFPVSPLERRVCPLNLRSTANIQFERPICRTNAFANSFFPDVISKWNDLPLELQESISILSFKRNVLRYLH